MKTLTYTGPWPSVDVGGHGTCARGADIDLPDAVADELLRDQPANWKGGRARERKDEQ